MPTDSRPRIGLLAGSGRFPVLFAEAARRAGCFVVCVGIQDAAPPELRDIVDRFYWAGLTRLGRMIRCFRRENVTRVAMAGKVAKAAMYTPWRWLRMVPDVRTLRFWYRRRRDNRDDTLLLAVIDEFGRDGIHFESALDLCPELLVKQGQLTRRQPNARELKDIAFGWELAKEMGRLDVGQSVVVKERAVLAVEAIEGTDRAILRAGELCPSGGFVVVKVAKPQQDMRFDVPTVGCSTLEAMRQAGGRVLAIEAEKTILVDREKVVRLANEYGMSIVVLDRASAAAAA